MAVAANKKKNAVHGKTKPAASKAAPARRASAPSSIKIQENTNSSTVPTRIQTFVDKCEIADLEYRIARGLDRLDESMLRSVFHIDATVDMGPGVFQGTATDYIGWILGVLQQARSTHHLVGNVLAQIEGDTATVESLFQSHYRLEKPTGKEDLFIGGRWLDKLERRPAGTSGIWKIAHRKVILDWTRTEIASDIFYHQNPDALWSCRTKTDPSYQMSSFPGSQSGGKLPSFVGRRYDSKSMKV